MNFPVTFQEINSAFQINFSAMLPDPYQGSYEVTPSQEEQILLTKNKSLADNIKINPIPSNYGLITYNGFSLTVS